MEQAPDDARLIGAEGATAAESERVAVLFTLFRLERVVEASALVLLREETLLSAQVISLNDSCEK